MSSLAAVQRALIPRRSNDQVAEAVERVAVRFIRTWGFTTIAMVSAHFRLLSRTSIPRASLARNAVGSLADLKWLDPSCEWFSLVDRESPMRTAVEKIYAVTGKFDQAEVSQALGKRHSFANVPGAVVQAFVSTLTARIAAGPRPSLATRLDREERVLVTLLRHAGGIADIATLQRAAAEHVVPPHVSARVLGASPLFLRTGYGLYRMVGTPARALALLSSPRWEAVL